jgi:hypothetical protein
MLRAGLDTGLLPFSHFSGLASEEPRSSVTSYGPAADQTGEDGNTGCTYDDLGVSFHAAAAGGA